MSGFKAFILRGNLVELAVAFIIGAAFATVVTTFTAVIMGLVAKIFGGSPNFDSHHDLEGRERVGIPVGAFLTALIAFLILAAVVYFFVVMPYTKAKEKFFPSPADEPDGTPEDIALLTEIRDALLARNTGSHRLRPLHPGTTGTTPPPTA